MAGIRRVAVISSNPAPGVTSITSREQALRLFGEGGIFTHPADWKHVAPVVLARPFGLEWRESNAEQLERLRKLLVAEAKGRR